MDSEDTNDYIDRQADLGLRCLHIFAWLSPIYSFKNINNQGPVVQNNDVVIIKTLTIKYGIYANILAAKIPVN